MSGAAILPEGVAPMPQSSSVFHRKLNHEPFFIERAEGSYLYEAGTGRKILDGCGGAAVVSVGHCVPQIVQAVAEQLGRLPYISSATFAHQVSHSYALPYCPRKPKTSRT
jgi:adenosylmethionine-8-amino-7-oxononanoate aminotransferase